MPGDRVAYDESKHLTINGIVASLKQTGEAPPANSRHATTYVEQLPGSRHRVLIDLDSPRGRDLAPHLRRQAGCTVDEQQVQCTVPSGRYLLMGDNRDNARDSRFLGFIEASEIYGRVSRGDVPLTVANDPETKR